MLSALLFLWLQRASFYVDLHQYALSRIPQDIRGSWIEVGCGPGLFSRMAVEHGFSGAGYDLNKQSIALANWLRGDLKNKLYFKTASIDDLVEKKGAVIKAPVIKPTVIKATTIKATVIAASSLLAVLPDKQQGLLNLWKMVEPGGILLIIEPTANMTVTKANTLIASGQLPAGASVGSDDGPAPARAEP